LPVASPDSFVILTRCVADDAACTGNWQLATGNQ
jgi:hypothetical protein